MMLGSVGGEPFALTSRMETLVSRPAASSGRTGHGLLTSSLHRSGADVVLIYTKRDLLL